MFLKRLIIIKNIPRKENEMRKRILSKITAAMLAGVMALGMVACGSTQTGTQESTSKEESKAESTVTSEVTAEEPTEITYPLTDADELSVWIYLGTAATYTSHNESPFHTGLSKMTGVPIDWQGVPKGTTSTQAYTLLLTEKELPNVIIYKFPYADGDTLINDGVVWDLTDYIPKYAPDYWKYLNDNDLLKEVTTDSGKIAFVNGFIESDFNATYMGPIVRKDWLDECGLDVPETLEDWENMLVMFKEKYNATLGSNIGDPDQSYSFLSSGAGAFTTLSNTIYIDDNGKVQNAMMQPEWVEYITLLNKWYDMGLLDLDMFTADNDTIRAKVLNGEIGATFAPMSQLTNFAKDAEVENTGAEFVGVPYPVKAKGDKVTWSQTKGGRISVAGAAVTTSSTEEELITALKLLNYGFTEEGMMYWNYGTEGETYNIVNGQVEFTDLITKDPDGLTEAMKKYTGFTSSGISEQKERMVQLKNNPICTDAVYTWIDNSEASKHALPPALALTEAEQTEYTDLNTAISTYAYEKALEFVTGVTPISEYDNFVETMEGMGYKRCLEIYQAAYDRYLSR